ncbi:MAG TPA: hypothetical protein VGZ48_09055 [Candidatus Acidoferrales bacterium]|nr:hypothetical protein [Candidatus Acidoferrales bacterium]
MPKPPQMLRVTNEIIFVLLGALIIGVSLTGHYMFNPRSVAWLTMSGLLIVYGLVTMRWRGGEGVIGWIRGGSLILVGLMMISLAYATMAMVTPLLITAGGILAARGLIVSALVLRGKAAR